MTRKTALVAPDPEAFFDAEDFAEGASVIAAVSGGGDSMALLVLLRNYLEKRHKPPRLIAVTVDHGLRPESAKEARAVADFCAALGIAHEIAHWKGEKPQSSLMARARRARYQLLYECARFHDAKVIFTGHNFDDVAETYLMRAARARRAQDESALPRGLAAMSRESLLYGEVRLIRPLLALRRADLRQFLKNQAVSWIEDPSNEDERFERVRLRHTLDEATIMAAGEAAKKAAIKRACYNARCVEFLEKTFIQRWGEIYQLDLNPAWFEDDFLPQYLADLACLVGGADHFRLASPQFYHLKSNESFTRFTWGGCVIEKQSQRVRLWRERRNLAAITVPAQSDAVWDNRYQITNESGQEIFIRPPEIHELRAFSQALEIPARCLLATPVIVGAKGAEMAVLQQSFIYNNHIVLRRILAPFYFLQTSAERVLIARWRQIFNIAIN